MKFEDAVDIILLHEGGYVKDPKDPGGETKFGISKKSYPNVDIKNLTRENAIQIYHLDYWERLDLEKAPPDVRLILFDAAVNHGQASAVMILQHALEVKVDGIMGFNTRRALAMANPRDLVCSIAIRRLEIYTRNKNWKHYGTGWAFRLLSVTAFSLK